MTRTIKHACITLAATLLLAACGPKATVEEAPVARVEGERVIYPESDTRIKAFVSAAAQTDMATALQLGGRIVWDEERTVRLYPAFNGRVAKIIAKPGDVVKPGQALASLASPDFGQAQADAARANADFALAEKNLARMRELHAHGVAAQKDLQSAEADYARAISERDRTSRRVAMYGGSAAGVDQQLTLKSPIAGVVVERNVNPGQEVRPDQMGNTPAMFVVTDPTRLWVQLDAGERDLAGVKPGQKIKLTTNAYPGQTFDARIDTVADFIDPNTRTIKVKGSLANTDRKLKGEMFANAEIATQGDGGIRVPVRAVFLSGNQKYVFVEEKPGRYLRVRVETGPEQKGMVQILTGLNPAQRVVVQGNLLLQEIYQAARKPGAS